MKFVVGVLTHNPIANLRWHLLERTLESLVVAFPQAKEDNSIIVLDNGSTDGTHHALWQNVVQPVVAHYEFSDGDHRPARGRNILANFLNACGLNKPDCILVFSDDDMYWKPDASEKLEFFWKYATDPQSAERFALVSGLLEPEYPWSKKLGERHFAEHQQDGKLLMQLGVELRETAPAAAWSLPAKHWSFVGPFPEDGELGEDVQVCQRLTKAGYLLGQLDLATHIGEGYSLCGNDSGRAMFAHRGQQ